ncbi:hypothetical protein BY996DRAFT_6415498 [Phakopsora pachyrhizi]|nr:hypothetical protein BY996DRAFT_6415498 [Phakopsora pachyrhizi]
MTDKEDEPLHSSDCEFLHPKKNLKQNCLKNETDLISMQPGPPKHGEKGLTDQGSVFEPNKSKKKPVLYMKTYSTFSTTKYLEDLGDNTLELLLLTLEAHLENTLDHESFIQELAKLNTSTNRHAAVVYLLMCNSHTMDLLGKVLQNYKGLILYLKKAKNYLPIPFGDEDNKAQLIVATEIMKNIIICDGNPGQPIPRLTELAKLLFEWAAPKGTSYSNK